MSMSRPLKCQCPPFCNCQLQEIQIEAPTGVPIGFVQQQTYCSSPRFLVFDNTSEKARAEINGPCEQCYCWCNKRRFPITDPENGQEIGEITKLLDDCITGFAACWTEVDKFEVKCKFTNRLQNNLVNYYFYYYLFFCNSLH